MWRNSWLACIVLAMAAGAALGAVPPAARTVPAEWRNYDMLVDLHDLPHRYTCDGLWYRFHDVLLAIGARPDMKILAYRCDAPVAAQAARSPRVQLQFALPESLSPSQARWADLRVVPTRVRLGPGHPASLKNGDCELLHQMKDALLGSLAQRVVSFDLACAAPAVGAWSYGVTVQVLQPVAPAARVAGTTSAAGRTQMR